MTTRPTDASYRQGAARSAAPAAWRPPRSTPRRRVVAIGLVVAVVGLGGTACSSDDGVDEREAAIVDLLARYPGQLDRGQAECYVDRVTEEIGPHVLAADAAPSDAQIRRLTAIRVDCIGVADVGRPATTPPSTDADAAPPTLGGPRTLGDDPALDALWAACEAGDGPACDQLFEAAPLGSDYEAFGATCGGRGAEERCAAVYPALPSSTTAPAASTTVTSPPPG